MPMQTKPLSAIERLIDATVVCPTCGTQGFLKCDCFSQCACGWLVKKGGHCENPKCPSYVQQAPIAKSKARARRKVKPAR
jgi:hypothetical protein